MRVSNQGIPPEEMHAVKVDLTTEAGRAEFGEQKFDMIVVRIALLSVAPVLSKLTRNTICPQCAASYHHIDDTTEITRILAGYLAPGGSLLVADILKAVPNDTAGGDAQAEPKPEEELLHHFRHVVPHRSGFSEDELRVTFEKARLSGFECKNVFSARLHEQDVDFFLARGERK